MNADAYIRLLDLLPHPEGGYYKETYRSAAVIDEYALPKTFNGKRNISTAIYFMLQAGDFSAFHRIKSDECWHFYAGGPLIIHVIENGGRYYSVLLGNDLEKNERLQFVVPADCWFASEPANGTSFSLVGCTVAPGFDFNDFEMADKSLADHFPDHQEVINRLTR